MRIQMIRRLVAIRNWKAPLKGCLVPNIFGYGFEKPFWIYYFNTSVAPKLAHHTLVIFRTYAVNIIVWRITVCHQCSTGRKHNFLFNVLLIGPKNVFLEKSCLGRAILKLKFTALGGVKPSDVNAL